jgi:hypothetical protein
MAENRYFAYSREDLREEIRVEREDRRRLEDVLSDARSGLRELERTRNIGSAVMWEGRQIPTAGFNTIYRRARMTGEAPDSAFERRMMRYGLEPAETRRLYSQLFMGIDNVEFVGVADVDRQIAYANEQITGLETDIRNINAQLDLKEEARKRPSYMQVEFTKFWEIREELVRGNGKTPRIRFEIRVVIAVPFFRIEAEEQRVIRLGEGVESNIERLLDTAIEMWDVGGELDLGSYYTPSTLGWEDLETVDRFTATPTFVITKYRNGRVVATWEWRGLTVDEADI